MAPCQKKLGKPVRSYRLSGATLSPRINIYTTLTNLQFALKFICRFIIREGAFCGNEVENLVMVAVLADVATNQLCVSYHALYIWPALNHKFPFAFNPVHLFLFWKLTLSPGRLINFSLASSLMCLIHSIGSDPYLGFLSILNLSFLLFAHFVIKFLFP